MIVIVLSVDLPGCPLWGNGVYELLGFAVSQTTMRECVSSCVIVYIRICLTGSSKYREESRCHCEYVYWINATMLIGISQDPICEFPVCGNSAREIRNRG